MTEIIYFGLQLEYALFLPNESKEGFQEWSGKYDDNGGNPTPNNKKGRE